MGILARMHQVKTNLTRALIKKEIDQGTQASRAALTS
jgi:hypothetical protein